MIESILERKHAGARARITAKALITLFVIALAVALPQMVHLVTGAPGGVKWMPMYLPVLLGGCLLGVRFGMAAGVLSPLCSFLLTALAGNPMPAAARLPFMMAELAIMAAVTGAFSGLIAKRPLFAIPAVALALLAGRSGFLLLVTIFQQVVPFTPSMILSQIRTGVPGLILSVVAVPLLVTGIWFLTRKGAKND